MPVESSRQAPITCHTHPQYPVQSGGPRHSKRQNACRVHAQGGSARPPHILPGTALLSAAEEASSSHFSRCSASVDVPAAGRKVSGLILGPSVRVPLPHDGSQLGDELERLREGWLGGGEGWRVVVDASAVDVVEENALTATGVSVTASATRGAAARAADDAGDRRMVPLPSSDTIH
ncbi:hypothetical protein BC567DRAFT_237367 [Phyllosticta citribraziliensis]